MGFQGFLSKEQQAYGIAGVLITKAESLWDVTVSDKKSNMPMGYSGLLITRAFCGVLKKLVVKKSIYINIYSKLSTKINISLLTFLNKT